MTQCAVIPSIRVRDMAEALAFYRGTLDFTVDTFFPTPGQNIRVLAVMAHKRLERLPDVPTLGELGYRSVNATSWVGFFAPRGTPQAVIEAFNAAVNSAWRDPETRKRATDVGFSVRTASVADFANVVAESEKLYGPVMKDLNIHID